MALPLVQFARISLMSFDPTNFDCWVAFLASFMERNQVDLAHIFDAASVRELWFQGQLHIAARQANLPFLCVNHRPQGYGGFADMTYWTSNEPEPDAQVLMLGELKLLGTTDYYTKNFDGHSSLADYQSELATTGKLVINATHCQQREWLGGRFVGLSEACFMHTRCVEDVRAGAG